MKLIDKDSVLAEIEKRHEYWREKEFESHSIESEIRMSECQHLMLLIDSFELKEVDLELVTGWFDHIAQIADDRMTLTGQRMTDAHALDEIKCLAKNSSEFITKHYKAQKGEWQ